MSRLKTFPKSFEQQRTSLWLNRYCSRSTTIARSCGQSSAICDASMHSDYRVLRAESGPAALEIVRELKVRNNAVALFLVDQRMPGLSGVEFLEQAITLYPDAKRVLLTAYADTDAAIAAINEAGINHYLLKPWDPPEENLYPVLDELLEDWQAAFPPQFEGIRVFGNRWSPASHNIKDFLARNHVPYQWLDIETAETDPDVRSVVELLDEEEKEDLPLVIFPNGRTSASADAG